MKFDTNTMIPENTNGHSNNDNDLSKSSSDAKATQTSPGKSPTNKPSRRSSKLVNKINDGPKSQSLFFTGSGGIDKIIVKEQLTTEPKEGEIRIAVKFAGINFLDLLKKQGIYPKSESFPFVAGSEASGIVEAVGSGVERFKVGDRVLAISLSGCFTTSICINQNYAFILSDKVKLEDAASLFINYVTAYDLLFRLGSLKSGQTILLPQAAGGIGHAVINLVKRIPNITIIALCSKSKHEYMRSLGVQHLIDYNTENYVNEVRNISPKGVDLVLDSLNGEDSVHAFNLLKPFGKVIHYGMASFSGNDRSLFRGLRGWLKCLSMNSIKIVNTNRSISGYNLNIVMKENPESANDSLFEILKMLENGEIQPHIDSIFTLANGKGAFSRMANRENVGKILLSTEATEDTIFTKLPKSEDIVEPEETK